MAGRVQLELGRGPQETFFTGDPEYTHFRSVFKKHVNHAIQSVDVQPNTTIDFGTSTSFRIPANSGDMIRGMYLKLTLSKIEHPSGDPVGWIESIGHAIIDHVDLLIGDALVQRLTGDVLQIQSEHNYTQTKQQALKHLIGKFPDRVAGTPVSNKAISAHLGAAASDTDLFIELPFYFHGEESLSIPLCAITKQEIEVVVKLRHYQSAPDGHLMVKTADGAHVNFTEGSGTPPHVVKLTLTCDNVFLDAPVREAIRSARKEYLITQYQRHQVTLDAGTTEARIPLAFVNPVKELFVLVRSRVPTGSSPFDYDNRVTTAGTGNGKTTGAGGRLILYEHLDHMTLDLDGSPVLNNVTGKAIFLKAVQPYMHHKKTPLIRRFYSYSFALEPEISTHSTGTVNFSMIKEQDLRLYLNPQPTYVRDVRVYASSFNILRVHPEGNTEVIFDCQM